MKDLKTGKLKNGRRISRQKRKIKLNYTRILLKLCKGGSFLLSVGILGILVYIFFGYLYTSPYFRVERIVVSGENRLSEIEVLNLARIDKGSNILGIDLRRVSDRIERHPWVQKAFVKRELPQRIIINVTERVPVAMINLDRLYLVDKKGIIFKEVGPEDTFDVPVLTGLESEDLATNERISRSLIEKALTIIDEVNKRGTLGVDQISEINMDPYAGLTIFTLEDGTQVKLGFDDYEQKLDHLKKVIADLQERGEKAEYINLNYGEKVYVKLDKTDLPKTLMASHETERR
ncbi:MAG: FtsQ-type POTRA domain-containing protein [Thermodesulfobacteriota bacterium]